jgi:hypothetical protein
MPRYRDRVVGRCAGAPLLCRTSVGKPHDEGDRDVESPDVFCTEAAYDSSGALPSDCNWLVDHDLGLGLQSICLARINSNPEVRRIGKFRSHLTNHDRCVSLWKGIRLDDNRRMRLSVVASRRDRNQVASSHRFVEPSNSENASIQRSASSSPFRWSPATCFATRCRTDKERASGRTKRSSRRPRARRRSRIVFIR